jgi:serine/threonine-protein kinase ATR
MQALLPVQELTEAVITTWQALLQALRPHDLTPHVAVTTASFVVHWNSLSLNAKLRAKEILESLLSQAGSVSGESIDMAADLSSIPELRKASKRVNTSRGAWSPEKTLQKIIDRSHSNNNSVTLCALTELKAFMLIQHPDHMRSITASDMFDPLVGQLIASLINASAREGEGTEPVRVLAFECMGVLGALDPDRFEMVGGEPPIVILNNFYDDEESIIFALYLVRDILVGTFRSTSDVQYQGHLAFAIQELLRLCKFDSSMVDAHSSVPLKVRNRWKSLPSHVLETVTPLLDAGYTFRNPPKVEISHPIYHNYSTYRDWMQIWVGYLITQTSGVFAQSIFGVFQGVIRQKDAAIASHLFPHIVLHVLLSANEEETQKIRRELLVVLEDQVDPNSSATPEKKFLSAQVVLGGPISLFVLTTSQAIFSLLDHLNKWVRVVRQDVLTKRQPQSRRSRVSASVTDESEEQLLRVDSILTSINRDLMARAALQCKAFALALMNFEHQIMAMKSQHPSATQKTMQEYYERLHEIYAHIDEPDGMEGISTMIMSPSLEHQIRQHESMGHWTSAQSCWEVCLQQSPDNLDFHLGLLRCLRNLGHYGK